MNNFFILKIAFNNLKSHRMRTILTLLGVIIGISTMIFLASFGFGLERLVTREVTTGNAFLLIDVGTGSSQVVKLDETGLDSIRGINGVKDVSVLSSVGARINASQKSMDISYSATDSKYLELSGIKVLKGDTLSTTSGGDNRVVVNESLLSFLALNSTEALGKSIYLDIIVPKYVDGGDGTEVKNQEFTISGVTSDKLTPRVYANYSTLKKLGISGYSQLKVELANKNDAPTVRKRIENLGLKTDYVGDTVSQITQIFNVFKVVLLSFGLTTLIVAILGMFNTLTISLLERIKEIALLKMLGMRKNDIKKIFLTESLLMGITGGLAGIMVGFAFGKLADYSLNYFALTAGGDAVSVFYFPLGLTLTIFFVSFVIGILSGLYPAQKAIKVRALDVLRYE